MLYYFPVKELIKLIETATTRAKVRQFLYILIPIMVTQIAMFSMTFFDTIMSGRYSADDLAGVAVGSSLWMPVYTGLSGILLSITPIVGHLIGGGRREQVSFSVMQGCMWRSSFPPRRTRSVLCCLNRCLA